MSEGKEQREKWVSLEVGGWDYHEGKIGSELPRRLGKKGNP